MVPLRNSAQVDEWDGKHPLADSWAFWYFSRALSPVWAECLKKIGSFATIEDFWSYMHHLHEPSQLGVGCELSIFKDGISPMWEDPANKRGGRWDIHLDKTSFSNSQLNRCWMNLAMDLIGHRFVEYDDMVNGAVISRRDKGSRVSMWTSTSENHGRLLALGKMLKSVLGLPGEMKMIFRTHQDCSAINSSHLITLRV